MQLRQANYKKKRAMLSDDMCKWQKLQMENDLAQNTHNIEREEIRKNKKSSW